MAQGLYAREMTRQVYAHLASCAEGALTGGYTAIVDATFARHEDRAHFKRLASHLGVELSLINCHAPMDLLRARVAQRHGAGRDASEADLAVLKWQATQREPVREEEGLKTIEVDMSASEPTPGLADVVARLG